MVGSHPQLLFNRMGIYLYISTAFRYIDGK